LSGRTWSELGFCRIPPVVKTKKLKNGQEATRPAVGWARSPLKGPDAVPSLLGTAVLWQGRIQTKTTQSLAMKESGKMGFVIMDSKKNFIKQIPLGKIIGDFSLWGRTDAGASENRSF
jgi:hypothetical protein